MVWYGNLSTYVVFVTELFVEGRAHDGAADGGWGLEVSFARLPSR